MNRSLVVVLVASSLLVGAVRPESRVSAKQTAASVDRVASGRSVVVGGMVHTTAKVNRLAADGRRAVVAYMSGSPSMEAHCIELWDTLSGAILPLHEYCDRRQEVAVGGTHVFWTSYEEGNHIYENVCKATITRRKCVQVYTNGNDFEIARTLKADGSLAAFAVRGLGLYRVTGSHATPLPPAHLVKAVLDVDHGHIGVWSGDGPVEILDITGKLIRGFPATGPSTTTVALDALHVLIKRGTSLAVYNLSTGRVVHTWTVDRGLLQGASRGIAAYVVGKAIHVLRISDGRESIIRVDGSGPVHAAIDSAGLFYTYSVADKARPGRIAFIRMRELRARFA